VAWPCACGAWAGASRPPEPFESTLRVTGEERYGYRILRVNSSAVPNTIVARLLHIRDKTGKLPHVCFS
jgi:hypothetical protein